MPFAARLFATAKDEFLCKKRVSEQFLNSTSAHHGQLETPEVGENKIV